jgi:CHAT domain-containing protein/Tfp pilus assembly protein PilF
MKFTVTGISLVASCLSFPALVAQEASHVANRLNPGIVVEQVAKNSEAVKAGVRQGDVLLQWSRETTHGEIQSPFELAAIEMEQGPRGTVTVEGLRGTEKKAWTLGPETWGIQARPVLSESLLAVYSEGRDLARAGKEKQAEERWRAVAGQVRGTSPLWLRSWLLFHVAEMQADARQWRESDAAYQEALQSAVTTGPEVQAHLLRAWAKTYQQRSDWPNAEKYYQQSITQNRKLNSENLMSAANYEDLGTVSRLRGDPAKAEEYFRQALEIRQKLAPGSLDVARSFNTLGIQARRNGDLAKAEEYHRRALEIRQRLAPGSLAVAASLNNLGSVTRQKGDLDRAEEYQSQSLKIKRELAPGSIDVADALNNLGIVLWQRGDLARAENYWREGLEIRQKLTPESLDVASSLSNLGMTADERGNRVKAEEFYRQALAIQQKLAPGSLDVAYTLNNLGEVAFNRGDLVKADDYYQQALEIKQKLAPASLDLAGTLSNLGELARQRGDLAKAEDYCRQALDIRQKLAAGSLDVSDSLNNLGKLALERKALGKAEEYFRLALEIRQRQSPASLAVADSLYNLGQVALELRDLGKAEDYCRQAVAIRSKLAPESKEQAESLASLARMVERKGELDLAAQLYEQALKALEGQTAQMGAAEEVRADFRAQHGKYYRGYIDLLVRQGRPRLAFDVLERSIAQTLLETLAASNIDIHRGADPRLLEKERSLQADIKAKSNRRVRLFAENHSSEQIKAVEKEISNLTAEYQDVEAQIRSSNPAFAALTHPRALSASEVQEKLLDTDTLLLEYSLGEERSHVFVVSADSLEVVELPKRAVIENEAQRVYDLLTERNRQKEDETYAAKAARIARAEAEYSIAVDQLSKTILEPIEARFTRTRLVIVGDGALYYVPFAALPSFRRGKALAAPLSAEHEIITLPSASVLATLRRDRVSRKPGTKMIAVLADPVFDREDTRVKAAAVNGRRGGTHTARAADDTQEEPGQAESSRVLANLMRSAADVGWEQERKGQVYLPRLQFSRQEANEITMLAPAGQSLKALDFEASRATAVSPRLADYRIVHFATHAFLNSEHPELSGLVLSLVDEHAKPQNGFVDLQDIYNLELPADLVVLSACETGLGRRIEGEGLVGLTRGFMYAGANRVVASLWNVNDQATAELMRFFYEALLRHGMRPAAALRAAQLQMRSHKRWSSPYFWAAFQIQGEWK